MVDAQPRMMRLRYAGICRACAVSIPPGTTAEYDPGTRTVICGDCLSGASTAGASARREHERRAIKRERETRAKHPRIGGFLLAISDEPQSTDAWATGAVGEERVGRLLDSVGAPTLQVLHDRQIPGTRANIDHIVVAANGVHVVDTKKYRGRPTRSAEGGVFSPRVHKLKVGSRDQTALVTGVLKQASLVREALDGAGHSAVPVHSALCFVDADWPLFGGSFSLSGVDVLWPNKLVEKLADPGTIDEQLREELARLLRAKFPPA